MKKFFLAIAIMAASAGASSAQDIRVSAGHADSKFTDSDVPNEGFFVGLTAEKALSGAIRFSTGLIYSCTGGVQPGSFAPGNVNVKEHYFSVPIHAVTRIGITRTVFIVLEAGPSVSIGIASNSTDPVSGGAVPGESPYRNLYGGDSNYGRFDITAGGQVGLEYRRLRVFGGCDYGLFDRDFRESEELHRTEIVAGVAFRF